jgi:hypothetical protein
MSKAMFTVARSIAEPRPTSVSLLLAAVHGAKDRALLDAIDLRLDRMALEARLRSVLESFAQPRSRMRRAS